MHGSGQHCAHKYVRKRVIRRPELEQPNEATFLSMQGTPTPGFESKGIGTLTDKLPLLPVESILTSEHQKTTDESHFTTTV